METDVRNMYSGEQRDGQARSYGDRQRMMPDIGVDIESQLLNFRPGDIPDPAIWKELLLERISQQRQLANDRFLAQMGPEAIAAARSRLATLEEIAQGVEAGVLNGLAVLVWEQQSSLENQIDIISPTSDPERYRQLQGMIQSAREIGGFFNPDQVVDMGSQPRMVIISQTFQSP